jgi:hypothetical protein
VPVELDRRDCDDEAHFFKDPPLQTAPASTAAPMTSPVERPLAEARTASFDMITCSDYAMPLDLDRVFGDFSAYGETHPKVRLVNGDIASGSAFEVSVSATESTRILAARSASGTCFLAKPTVSTVRNGATYSITFASHDAAQPCIATTEAAWADFW